MKITEIQIKNFGKLHNINIRPLPGINVIYGENETGKSTLQQFIRGMLFGIEKQRGRAGKNDSYQQYEPWNSNSYYAGGLRFTVDGKPFLLERNFYHKEKSVKLVNEKDLEELSVEHGDLEMLLGGMSKETYENTFCISQACVETKKEFADVLQNYFVNASLGGDGGVNLSGARRRLKEGQKAADQKYREKVQERKEEEERLLLEEKLLKKDIEQLKKQQKDGYKSFLEKNQNLIPPEPDINQMAEYLRNIRQQREQQKYDRRFGISLFFMTVGLLLGIWNCAAHLFSNPAPGWIGLEVFTVILCLVGIGGVYYWHRRSKQLKILRRKQEEETKELMQYTSREREQQRYKEQQEKQARQRAVEEMLQIQLLEKQAELMNLREELEECRVLTPEELEYEHQVRAYELAYHTLEQLSQEAYQDTRAQMEQEISRILSELTNGKYTKIGLDAQMNLVTTEGKRRLHPWQLSQGTMEQMYMALRMGAGGFFTREESMPILLDEVFVSFDEKRLEGALQWLGKQKQQIFLFTCQKREMEILERNGIPFGKIMLSR
ncbi:MAG: AAA family ATPase [Lachnospiraceae bacterium]|nr:AAA family ATPase [Lachnospiraceae bacterium]